ncbi:NADH:flavin oxidoreductase/NADH oxidase family protein [Paecilomyces variotii No. 5]|uniref:NADH:flavin oxidoreductase/NADH oxidase family protein n=1 Tax=Byssochlamys spectabilis (strain No. 5 / NBRC 109023) TaxID=1356009 RepID=V5G284_BYSSN|nr:NADH:flavin oxidoreductase/NADH oxidase family protein [Paecilomyces variotii No. 5]
MTKLFTPIKVGSLELPQRLAMAPMTRFRADDDHVPLPFVEEYYQQRAAVPGTLIITEATFVSARNGGYPNVPGIYSKEQIAAWKKITDAVHAKGSFIYLQLWGLGRAANPDVLKQDGYDLVSSSAVPMSDNSPTPRALTEEEIWSYIGDYAQGAKNAIEAGFDGVEIHAANGYLIDQFTQDTCNKRTDSWGGSIENRARFALEVTKAVTAAVGADKTGIRLSPWSTFQGMRMEDPIPQFTYLAKKLAEFKLAYAHVVESRIAGNADIESTDQLDFFFEAYANATPVIVAGGYKAASAKDAVDSKYKDYDVIIGIGRPWTSNPDLVFKIKHDIELVPYVRDHFYMPKDPHGYIDYPFSEQFLAAQSKI